RHLRLSKQDLLEHRPDVLILVDFPGFNLRIAGFAKEQGIPVFYDISPQIWAWSQQRVLKIKREVDTMFCILPFAVDFYRSWGMEVDYVGNPLADAVAVWKAGAVPAPVRAADESKGAGLPVIALLPGSRKQEITRILPEMLKAAGRFKGYRAVI